MTKLRLFILIALGFIVLVWWTLSREHLAIDTCLDAGGKWDYDAQKCAP